MQTSKVTFQLTVFVVLMATCHGYLYDKVARCPLIAGDPNYEGVKSPVTVVYAVSKAYTTEGDRCNYIYKSAYWVTGNDGSLTSYPFVVTKGQQPAYIYEVGPNGVNYTGVILKTYGSKCANMNLFLRCIDNVDDDCSSDELPFVQIASLPDVQISEYCLADAREVVKCKLGVDVSFTIIPNVNCVKTFLPGDSTE